MGKGWWSKKKWAESGYFRLRDSDISGKLILELNLNDNREPILQKSKEKSLPRRRHSKSLGKTYVGKGSGSQKMASAFGETLRYSFNLLERLLKMKDSKYWWECGGKGPLEHCWWRCILVQQLWPIVWRVLKKLTIELAYDPANL